jgi:cathepsin X
MGAFSDRFAISTNNALKVQLSVQLLLNFDGDLTGGSCLGGDSLRAYKFAYKYGITDDTCAPFLGMNYGWGFDHAEGDNSTDVMKHLCQVGAWDGERVWLKPGEFNYYSAEDFGDVLGPDQMMAEIYARGPIACSLNSSPDSFDLYRGGIISEPTPFNDTDHVVAITGWGVDTKTQQPYWVGRNSYGTRWGEGAGGGWFRLLRGKDTLAMESHNCHWAVPSVLHVERALKQARDSQ